MSNAALISNALLLTNPQLYASIDGGNSWLAALTKRGARVKLYRDYEAGEGRNSMTAEMRQMLRLSSDAAGLNNLDDNYCETVIDKMAGRVAVAEISVDDERADKDWLEPLLAKQDFQAAEGMWWRGAILDGDAYVMIDPVTLLWSSEPAFDGFSGMTAIYNQMTRKPIWACKLWSESDTQDREAADGGAPATIRMVVYQPEKISYWKGADGSAAVEPDPQEDGKAERQWPVEMKGALPFVSYANKRSNYSRYGDSEIKVAIPLQDVLNRTMYSMVMASEFAAFGVNVSIGMEITPGGIVPGGVINLVMKDSAGKVVTEYTPEQIAFLAACKVDQLSVADISQYTQQIETVVREISQATQTPIYGITTNGAISGDALKQLEIGLIGKVIRFQRQNTDALKELILLTAQMERVFAPGLGTPEITTVNVTWKSPELLDANAAIAGLVTMRKDAADLWSDDFYRQKIGQLMGMSKDDILKEAEALKAQKAKEPPKPAPVVVPAGVAAPVVTEGEGQPEEMAEMGAMNA